MKALLFLLIVFAPCAFGQSLLRAEDPLEVYSQPLLSSKVSLEIAVGEEIKIWPAQNGFHRVSVFRSGKWRRGYVSAADLRLGKRKPAKRVRGGMGVSGAYIFSSLSQGAKSFTTKDQVQYTTSEYRSLTHFPALGVQFGFTDFWRYHVFFRKVAFETEAKPNVASSSSRQVEIEYFMLAVNVQKVWSIPSLPPLFWGLGLEFSKTLTDKFKIDGGEIELGDANEPFYTLTQALLGMQWVLSEQISVTAEGKLVWIPNQAPMVMGYEGSVSLVYWR